MTADELESEYLRLKKQAISDAIDLGYETKSDRLIKAIKEVRDMLFYIALWLFFLTLHSCSK